MERKPSGWYCLICPHNAVFDKSRTNSSAVRVENCQTKPGMQVGSNQLEILASSWSKVEQSPTKHFDLSADFSAAIEPEAGNTVLLKELEHLAINQHVMVSIKVLNVEGRVTVSDRQLPKQDCIAADLFCGRMKVGICMLKHDTR